MFKLPEFPAIDFSALDLNALRDSELGKRITANVQSIDTEKARTVVRDAAYMTVGLGVIAVERAQARVNSLRSLIRNAA